MINASKEKIDAQQAWALIKDSQKIHVTKGKKAMTWYPAEDKREAILKSVIGPSGNLRAPTWRIGNDFLIGFNPEQYEEVLG